VHNLFVISVLENSWNLFFTWPDSEGASLLGLAISLGTEFYILTFALKGAQPNFALVVKFYEPVPSHIKTDYTR